jgi:hypothetical protein
MDCHYKRRTTVLFTGLWAFKETFNNISAMMRNSLKLVEKMGLIRELALLEKMGLIRE